MTNYKQWYVSRNDTQFGPYSWDDIVQYARSGNISETDMLWSQSSGSWFAAGRVEGLFPGSAVYVSTSRSDQKPTIKRRKSGLMIAGISVLAVLLVFVLLTFFRQDRFSVPDIVDHYPQNGPAGSHIYVLFDDDISALTSDLQAFYNDEPIFIVNVFEDYAEIILPDNATSGEIKFRAHDSVSNTAAFTVEPTKLTLLHEEVVVPAETEQIIRYKDEITITIPPGVIDKPRSISISLVENAPVNSINPLATAAIDITIEGLSQLSDYIGIGMKYEPDALDSSLDSADQLMTLRYDEQYDYWVPLPIWVDEESQMVYMETDHLSYLGTFLSVPSGAAVIKTVATTGAAVAAVTTGAWIGERLTFTTYPTKHFRVMYNHKSMDIIYRDWDSSPYAGQLEQYDDSYPKYIQDMGAIFETAFENYVDRGFKNPVVRPGRIYGMRHDPITIKISGVWSTASGYLAGGEEPQYGKIFGNIHLPSYIFRHLNDQVRPAVGHELFHVIQSQYYRMHRYLDWVNTGDYWWIEATAEYAGLREAWGKDNKQYDRVMSSGVAGDFFSYPLNSTNLQGTMTKDYEYLSSLFIRFLVDEMSIDFKELFEFVSTGEPFERLESYIRSNYQTDRFVDFELAYIMFARWGFFSPDSFLNSFSTWQVADKMESIHLSEEGSLHIDISDNEDLWFEVYKSEDMTRSNVWDYNIPLEVMGSGPVEASITGIDKGEVIYIMAVNNTRQNQSVPVSITLEEPTDGPDGSDEQDGQTVSQDNKITHTFNLSGTHTAQIWAIEISKDPLLEIEPVEIIAANINEEYSFTLTASHLPQNPVTEVDFEWDFGDDQDESTGQKANIAVRNGRASIDLTYTYEKPDEFYTITAIVKDSASGEKLADVTAKVVFNEYMVVIQGEREVDVILPQTDGDDGHEYKHQFEAVVRPEEGVVFQFDWDFGDGHTYSETGDKSSYVHTYQDVKIGDQFNPSVSITLPNEKEVISEDSIHITFKDDTDLSGVWTGTMQLTDIGGALDYAQWLSEWITRGLARIIIPLFDGEMPSDDEIRRIASDAIEVNEDALKPFPMVVELSMIDENIYQASIITTTEGHDTHTETTAEYKNGRLFFKLPYDDGYTAEFSLALDDNRSLRGEFEISLGIFQSIKGETYLYR